MVRGIFVDLVWVSLVEVLGLLSGLVEVRVKPEKLLQVFLLSLIEVDRLLLLLLLVVVQD